MKTIDLINLEVELRYDYQSPSIGGMYPDTGDQEVIPASITIHSVRSGGIEIISIIPEDQLQIMEEELLEEITKRN